MDFVPKILLWITILKKPWICGIDYTEFLSTSLVTCSTTITLGFINYCSSITSMSPVYNVYCRCTRYCASIMVCVWPLSPLILWSWCCCSCCNKLGWWRYISCCNIPYWLYVGKYLLCWTSSAKTLTKTYFSNCVTVYSSTTSSIIFHLLYNISSLQFYRYVWLSFLNFSIWTCFILIKVWNIKIVLKSCKGESYLNSRYVSLYALSLLM